MKKLLKIFCVCFLFSNIFAFLACKYDGDVFNATTQIDSVDVEANAYPGVNILTWKAVKDASTYSVYKTTGNGNIEECLINNSSNTFYYDTRIEKNTSYKYRIVANPKDSIVHDASQKEVILRTAENDSWAPSGTDFLSLIKYENDKDNGEEILSSSSISVELVPNSSATVRVKFPVKKYARYLVCLAKSGCSDLYDMDSIDDVENVYGFDFNEYAIVDLQAVYSGEKEITVKAIPLNSIYNSNTVYASSKVNVSDYDNIDSAVSGLVNAKWTNYNSYTKVANSRVYFTPVSFDGKVFSPKEYTIYRAVIGSSSEYLNGKYVYNSVEKLGSPKKDSSISVNGETVYYYDDSINIDSDISKLRYYVILNYNDKIKSSNTTLIIPDSSDDEWNFIKETNNAYIYDLYIDTEYKLNVSIRNRDYAKVSFTYGEFDSLNEAKVAVEKELSKTISFELNESSYYIDGTSTDCVKLGKYYAFRFVAQKTDAEDVVKTVIATPKSSGSYYYLDVKLGSENINHYSSDIYSPYVTISKDFGRQNFNSITLKIGYSPSAKYFNVYRQIQNSTNYSDYKFELIGTINLNESSTFIDSSDTLKSTSLENTVFYKIEAIGYYSTKELPVESITGLPSPDIYYFGSSISWNSIDGATRYEIYRSKTENGTFSYYKSVYPSSSLEIDITESSSDYYYAVKAYRSSDLTYSAFSNIVKVEKKEVPSVSNFELSPYSYNGSIYYFKANWEPAYNYSGNYYTLKYQTDSNETKDDVKTMFESNPSLYSSLTISEGETISVSSSYDKAFIAIATKVYDTDSSSYLYGISDVIEIPMGTSLTVTANYSTSTYDLSWDSIEGASNYGVYYMEDSTGTLYFEDIDISTLTPTIVSTTNINGIGSTSSSSYKFFLVIALDENEEQIGFTKIVRKL